MNKAKTVINENTTYYATAPHYQLLYTKDLVKYFMYIISYLSVYNPEKEEVWKQWLRKGI